MEILDKYIKAVNNGLAAIPYPSNPIICMHRYVMNFLWGKAYSSGIDVDGL